MRLFIINSFLFLAVTLTLAAPITLSSQDIPKSLTKSLQGVGDKNAVVSSSPTTSNPHTPDQGSDDQASLVRRAPHPPPVWKDGLPGARMNSGIKCTGCVGKRGIFGKGISVALGRTARFAGAVRAGQRRPKWMGRITGKLGAKFPIKKPVRTIITGKLGVKLPNKLPINNPVRTTTRTGQQRPNSPNLFPNTLRNALQHSNALRRKSPNKVPIRSPNKLRNTI